MHAPPTIPAPAAGPERIDLIDALRGFALAGVLLVNLDSFTLYDYLDDAARAALPSATLDSMLRRWLDVFANDKAITLFSLLFGLGFAVQLERADARGAPGLRLYLRRVAVLGLFGLIHAYLLWWGDILLIYALLALRCSWTCWRRQDGSGSGCATWSIAAAVRSSCKRRAAASTRISCVP